jgi:hypothetical protein
LVVDFGDDKRPLSRKKPCAAAEDFVLTALHVYLNQLRRKPPGCDEVIQRDCRNIYGFARRQYWAVSVGFNATLGPDCCAATKGNPIAGGTRPYSSMYHLKVILQSVPRTVAPQALNIFGVSIKSDNTARVAHKQGSAQSHGSHVRANIIDNSTRPNGGQNCILHFGFMLSTPEAYFSGNTDLNPHSLG